MQKGHNMKKGLTFTILLFLVLMVSGCSGTWQGVKKDTSNSANWSKDKVNDGAKYIEKKTD
jgi:predicted small secreted protein